ncbi:hypothetical protein [Streptomyces syringium]
MSTVLLDLQVMELDRGEDLNPACASILEPTSALSLLLCAAEE